MTKHLKNNNFILGVAIYILWVIVYSFYNYHSEKTELLANLEQQLERAARNYINIIPDNLHHKNMSKNDLTKEEDFSLLLHSNEYAKTNQIHYLYSMIKKDNKIYFTMGNGTEEDMADRNGYGYYFYLYGEAEPHIYKSFEVTKPFFHNTVDSWGSFRSVFIPFTSKDGTKFVIGADITTGHINELLLKELGATLIVSILFLVFAIPTFLAFTSQTRRWAKNIESQTKIAVANEAKLVALVKLAVDAIITIDDKGIVTTFNDAACAMFGYTEEEIVGNNVKILMHESDRQDHDLFIQSYSEQDNKSSSKSLRELLAQRKNGEIFPVEISVSKVIIDNKENIITAIIRDLTEKKEKEKQLHLLIDKAEAANKAKSDFLDKMSHELRTPLHGILAFANLGENNSDPEKFKKYFTNINKSGERLKSLLDDLLDISKLEAGKMKLDFTRQNLKELIYDCIMEQQGLINQYTLKVTIVENTNNNDAECDISRISQVILNLLNNAIKFSPENSTITITLSSAKEIDNNPVEALQVSISDQGPGVSEDNIENIFNKFSQVNTVDNKIVGTGLGLSIAREIILAHNGSIWCQKTGTIGAEFVFRIPVHHR